MSNIDLPAITGTKVTLERLRHSITKHLGSTAADSMRVEMQSSITYYGMVMTLSVDVLAEKLVDEVLTTWLPLPANPWQLFKEQYLPKWFIRRFPVKTADRKCRVEYKKYATYPRANVALPPDKFGYVVFREDARVTL